VSDVGRFILELVDTGVVIGFNAPSLYPRANISDFWTLRIAISAVERP
jgi:hypothetical protein